MVVADRPPADLVEAALHYIDYPVDFVVDMLGAHPDPWQAEALEALARGESVTIRSGHGVGKSALLAWAIIWFLCTRPGSIVPCTAPTQRQLHDVLWAESARWIEQAPAPPPLIWSRTKVAMAGHEATWFAAARASNRPENIAGFHAPHLLFVVDEGSGVPDAVFEVIDGAQTTAGALVLMAGNPTKRSGYFIDSHGKDRWAWHAIHISSEDSPRVDPAWVERMAKKWGHDSDVFRVRVQGHPPRAEADTFISLDLAELAAARAVEPAGPLEMGVDVARYGDSETVMIARRGTAVVAMEPLRKRDTQEVAGEVIAMAKRLMEEHAYPGITIKVDDTGIGGGVTDALMHYEWTESRYWRADSIKVVPCNFGGAGDEHYVNATGVMWGTLRDLMTSEQLAIPNDDDLIGQLTSRKYTVVPRGIVLETKEQMRRRELPSPDRADALALAFYAPGQQPLPDDTRRLLQGASFYGS